MPLVSRSRRLPQFSVYILSSSPAKTETVLILRRRSSMNAGDHRKEKHLNRRCELSIPLTTASDTLTSSNCSLVNFNWHQPVRVLWDYTSFLPSADCQMLANPVGIQLN